MGLQLLGFGFGFGWFGVSASFQVLRAGALLEVVASFLLLVLPDVVQCSTQGRSFLVLIPQRSWG